jgi:hypothetical protein
LKYWCKELNCTEGELTDAVAAVSDHVGEVRDVLATRRSSP